MIDWPQELVADLGRRKAVVVLGSGISRNSVNADGKRPSDWVEFLNTVSDEINPKRHIQSLMKQKDYLTACEVIKKSVGRDMFHNALRAEFLTPQYEAADIHASIFKLDSRIVATPNFDKIYETYANHEANGSIVIKHHYDPDVAEAIRSTGRVILKIHGTIDSPERMIFTRREYAEAREKYRQFYSLLEALALTHTFLFIGCGINDPDIRLLLEDTFFRHPSARPHIFVLPTGMHKSVVEIMQESMNISILTYSPAKNHKALMDSIENLANLVEQHRGQLRENLNW